MERSVYYEKIKELLLRHCVELHADGRNNLQDSAVHSEYFYRDLLNIVFSLHLKNANQLDPNMKGYDLVDREAGICFQVSKSATSEKVNSTLKKISEISSERYRIRFMFLVQKAPNFRANFKPYENVIFDPAKDILDVESVLRFIIDLDIQRLEQVYKIVCAELDGFSCLSLSKEHESDSTPYFCERDYVKRLLDDRIKELGPKYSPELNIQTEASDLFAGLLETESFYETVNESLLGLQAPICSMHKNLDCLRDLTGTMQIEGVLGRIESAGTLAKQSHGPGLYKQLDSIISMSDELFFAMSELQDYKNHSKFQALYSSYDEYRNAELKIELILNHSGRALKGPLLIVEGVAGVGKSHLFAYSCLKALSENRLVYLALGQYFAKGISPINQLVEQFAPGIEPHSFFTSISKAAGENRVLIAIDALNEGDGQFIWKNWLTRLINEIKEYPNIRLAVSVRSPLEDSVIPDELRISSDVCQVVLDGFSSNKRYAIESFCSYYNLTLPQFPSFGSEACNPLFLKLTCDYLSTTSETRYSCPRSFGKLMAAYLEKVTKRICAHPDIDLGFDSDVVVRSALNMVAASTYRYGSIPWNQASKIACKLARDEGANKPSRLIELMVSEGILNKTHRYGMETEQATFSFERLENYFEALNCIHVVGGSAVTDAIKGNKYFRGLINERKSTCGHEGTFEVLACLLPDLFDIELIDVLDPEILDSDASVPFWIISSLQWRDVSVISVNLQKFIDERILPNRQERGDFLLRLLADSLNPNTVFNADCLNGVLMSWSAKERDAKWTSIVSLSNSELIDPLDIVEWIWDYASELNEHTARLAALSLMWLLASTDNRLRDRATKALACILANRSAIAAILVQELVSIDDDYIIERSFAAMLGAFWVSDNRAQWVDVAFRIRDFVFASTHTYPNILVRDYARSLCEGIVSEEAATMDDFANINPPYSSEWDSLTMSNEQQKETVDSIASEFGDSSGERLSVSKIVHSMRTEHGKHRGMYGDFGRYTFGSAVRLWSNQWNEQELADMVVAQILKKRYSIEYFAEFDALVARHEGRFGRRVERIGKKYQWIETYRLLARLDDNYPPFEIEHTYKEGYEAAKGAHFSFSKSLLSRLIESNISDECTTVDYDEIRRLQESWDENKWVSAERKTLLSDGAVQQKLICWRDIDPTFVWQNSHPEATKCLFVDKLFLPKNDRANWLSSNEGYELLDKYRAVVLNQVEYIPLAVSAGMPSSYGKIDGASLYWLSGGVFIPHSAIHSFINLHNEMNDNGVPERSFAFNFLYDYCGTSAFHSTRAAWDSEMQTGTESYIIAAQHYEGGLYDDSSFKNNESPEFYLPCEELIREYSLVHRGISDWLDPEGELVCFDSSAHGFKESVLLFEKSRLESFLNKNDYVLAWGEFFSKDFEDKRHYWWQSVLRTNGGKYKATVDREENDAEDIVFENPDTDPRKFKLSTGLSADS